jgi:hypothetical protein
VSKPKAAYLKSLHQAQGLSRKLPTGLVCARYGISDTTLRRWTRDARLAFPQPFTVAANGGVNFWDQAELDEFDQRRRELAPEIFARTSMRRREEIAARKLKKSNEPTLNAAPDTGDDAATAVSAEQHLSVPQMPPRLRRPS